MCVCVCTCIRLHLRVCVCVCVCVHLKWSSIKIVQRPKERNVNVFEGVPRVPASFQC